MCILIKLINASHKIFSFFAKQLFFLISSEAYMEEELLFFEQYCRKFKFCLQKVDHCCLKFFFVPFF